MNLKPKGAVNSVLKNNVSVFADIKTKQPILLNLEDVLNSFKSKSESKEIQFSKLSNAYNKYAAGETEKHPYNELKHELEVVRFAGEFIGWSDNDFKLPSGLMITDFDGFGDDELLEEIKAKLSADKHTLAVFKSPSGDGLKALIKIPLVSGKDEYKRRYNAYQDYYLENIYHSFWDNSNSNISRGCFACYDVDLYSNYDAAVFTDIEAEQVKPKIDLSKIVVTDGEHKFAESTLADACKKIANAVKGELNSVRTSQAHRIGCLVGGNQIDYHNSLNALMNAVSASGTKRLRLAEEQVLKSFEAGIKTPRYFVENNVYQYDLPKVKNNNKHKLKTQFIGEDKEACKLLIESINNNDITTLISQMGTGKTHFIKDLIDNEFKHEKFVFVAPIKAIEKQAAYDLSVYAFDGDLQPYERSKALKSRVIVATYNSLDKVQDLKDRILIPDESHSISSANFQSKETDADVCTRLTFAIEEAKKTIMLSGTSDYLIDSHFKSNVIELESETSPLDFQPIQYNKKHLIESLTHYYKGLKSVGKHLLQFDNKTELRALETELTRAGFNVFTIYTDDDVEQDDRFKKIINEALIDDAIDIVLTTCKINEGVNINNKDISTVSLVLSGANNLNDKKNLQWFKRPRKTNDYTINIFIPKTKSEAAELDLDYLIANESAIKSKKFTKVYEQAAADLKLVHDINFSVSSLFGASTKKEDRHLTTLIDASGLPRTVVCLPNIINDINEQFFVGFGLENYVKFLSKKYTFLRLQNTIYIDIKSDKGKALKQAKKSQKQDFLNLIKEDESTVIKTYWYKVKNKSINKKIDKLYLTLPDAADGDLVETYDKIKSFDLVNTNFLMNQFLWFKQHIAAADVVVDLLDSLDTDSKINMVKNQISYHYFNSNYDASKMTFAETKMFDRLHKIHLAFKDGEVLAAGDIAKRVNNTRSKHVQRLDINAALNELKSVYNVVYDKQKKKHIITRLDFLSYIGIKKAVSIPNSEQQQQMQV